MKIILLDSVQGLGDAGAVVDVADGYARNYLLPRKLALAASKENIKQREHHLRMISQTQQKHARSAQAVAARIEQVELKLEAPVGEAGRLHGTITAAHVAAELHKQHGLEVDRHAITFDEPIKVAGAHQAKIKLHKDVQANLKIEVAPKAETQS